MTRPAPGTGDDMVALADELLGNLPLRYIDGPEYCTVKDATGGDFALTVQPELMKRMEAALSAPPASRIEQEAGMREALETAKNCIEDLGSGKGGWAWEEVLTQIDAALAAKTTAGVDALEPFIKAAKVIAARPQDYENRVAMIGGLTEACDLTKRHFADLLASLPPASGRDR